MVNIMRSYEKILFFAVGTLAAPSFAFATIFGIVGTTAASSSPKSCEKESIGDLLEKRVVDLFDEASTLPVSLTRNDGNIEVRTKFEGQHLTSLAEARVDQPPSAFKGYLENYNDAFAETVSMVKEIQHLEIDETDKHKREGIKAFLQFPFPVSDRLMIHWKYLKLDRNQDEHLMMLSEDNNETLLDRFLSKKEEEKYVLARTFLCAYWVKPIRDSKEKIIGSSIKYVYSGDVGGSMPQKVQRWVAPKNALDSIRSVIGYGKKVLKN